MSFVDIAKREINCKIVYHGPGLSGKSTNLQYIFQKTRPDVKGKMISLATETERTLFFDFVPLSLGKIQGYTTRFHLHTVPGPVFYDASRKIILKGVDGVVFVADSQAERVEANLESFEGLEQNLFLLGFDSKTIPLVFQYNKQDLPTKLPPEELDRLLNRQRRPSFAAVACEGRGVFDTLKACARQILILLKQENGGEGKTPVEPSALLPEVPTSPEKSNEERLPPAEDSDRFNKPVSFIQTKAPASSLVWAFDVRSCLAKEPSLSGWQELVELFRRSPLRHEVLFTLEELKKAALTWPAKFRTLPVQHLSSIPKDILPDLLEIIGCIDVTILRSSSEAESTFSLFSKDAEVVERVKGLPTQEEAQTSTLRSPPHQEPSPGNDAKPSWLSRTKERLKERKQHSARKKRVRQFLQEIEHPFLLSVRILRLYDEYQAESLVFDLRKKRDAGKFKDLVELRLGPGITAKGVAALVKISGLQGLETLDLSRNAIGAEGVRLLSEDPPWKGLRALHLGRNQLDDDGLEALVEKTALTGLRLLDLDCNRFGGRGLSALAASPLLATVETLNLSHNRLTKDGCRALAESPYLSALRVLYLHDCGLSDEDIEPLFKAPWLGGLVNLALSENRLTLASVRAFAETPALENLEELDICHNGFEEAEASVILQGSPYLRGVRRFCLEKNTVPFEGTASVHSGHS